MAQITLNSSGVASNGTLALQSNGTTTAVTIDASQNVGIGTASPSQRVDSTVSSTTEGSGLAVTNSRVDGYGSGISFYSTATDATKLLAGQVGMRGTGTWANTANASSSMTFSTVSAGTNTERMRIDSSGNVGIGTSSPGYRLDVEAATAIARVKSSTGTNAAYYTVNNTGGDFYIGRENSAGTAFGTTAYASVLWAAGAYPMSFFTNGTERARIDSSGNLLVGTTSSGGVGHTFYPQGFYRTARSGTASQTHIFFNNGNGDVGSISTSGSATTYSTSSDYRLKENIQPMTGALSVVQQLNPVTYNWKADGSDGQGFIAHELQAVCPDAVTGEKDAVDADGSPQYQGVDTSFLVATLTAAIQELKAIVDAQAVEIAALKGTA